MAGAGPSLVRYVQTRSVPGSSENPLQTSKEMAPLSLFTSSSLNRFSRLSRTSQRIFWGAGLRSEKGEVLVCYAKKQKVFLFQEIFEKRTREVV